MASKFTAARECSECGELFEAEHYRRTHCYKAACEASAELRHNRRRMKRVKRLKVEGKWDGIGGGYRRKRVVEEAGERHCLKCGKEGPRYLCAKCREENELLLNEYSEEALGIAEPPIRQPEDRKYY